MQRLFLYPSWWTPFYLTQRASSPSAASDPGIHPNHSAVSLLWSLRSPRGYCIAWEQEQELDRWSNRRQLAGPANTGKSRSSRRAPRWRLPLKGSPVIDQDFKIVIAEIEQLLKNQHLEENQRINPLSQMLPIRSCLQPCWGGGRWTPMKSTQRGSSIQIFDRESFRSSAVGTKNHAVQQPEWIKPLDSLF